MASKKKITTKDVAKYANVSQSAVSMILNQKSNVSFSEETRIKVLNAAKELGYEKRKKGCSARGSFQSHRYYVSIFVQPLLLDPCTFHHRARPRLWICHLRRPYPEKSQHGAVLPEYDPGF